MRIRCPHCHNPVEVVDTDPLTHISCPTCGSDFDLISGETASYMPGTVRRIAHFDLLESLGTGRFGTVWKARDTKLDRMVAVKIPRAGQIEGPDADMFFRDARAAAQVQHPGVAGVHEVGREGETLYIVSDYIEGCNLKDWLTGRRLTPRESAQLCAKIAEALHAAHEAGVVHRDLKPGNIMMDLAGGPHIIDFGLAKREAGEITMTMDGQLLGTPAYMSPEQAIGATDQIDERSDVYSLAVMLYELLSLQHYLPGRTTVAALLAAIVDEPHAMAASVGSPHQPPVPAELSWFIEKGLAKDPAARFQSVAAMAEQLERVMAGAFPVQCPVTFVKKAGGNTLRYFDRHPAVMIGATLAAVSLVVLGLVDLIARLVS
jgi:serine/threonine protein kinase